MKIYIATIATWAVWTLAPVNAFTLPKLVTTSRVALSSERTDDNRESFGDNVGEVFNEKWPFTTDKNPNLLENIGAAFVYPQVNLTNTTEPLNDRSNLGRAYLFHKDDDDKATRKYAKWNFSYKKFDGNVRDLKSRKGFFQYPLKGVGACLVLPTAEGQKQWPAYFFDKNQVVKWNLRNGDKIEGRGGQIGKVQNIEEVFPNLPDEFKEAIDGVCVLPNGVNSDPEEARAVFFRRENYVVLDLNNNEEVGKGKFQQGFEGFKGYQFDRVTSALVIPDDGLYLFNGKKYARWNLQKPVAAEEYPKLPSNIRFNKCPPVDKDKDRVNIPSIEKFIDGFYPAGGVHKDVFPLTNRDYPLRGDKLDILKQSTTSDSVIVADDVQLKREDLEYYLKPDNVTNAEVTPLYPGDEGFWDEMAVVSNVQDLRLSGYELKKDSDGLIIPKDESSSELIRWPDLWYNRTKSSLNPWPGSEPDNTEILTLEDVAQSVRGEFSNYHQQVLLVNLTKENVELATDIGLPEDGNPPIRSAKDFIGMQVRMAAINAWSLEAVGPINFYLKWRFGVPRPEEVAWLIKSDNITVDDVPKANRPLIKEIKGMKLEKATDFTAYKEGSPTHPSFPAMHSAGSTCSLWVPTLYKLTREQYLETIRMDYAVAFARTVAGVHYPQDNIAGLNIGQRIIRDKLPHYLMHQYGYNYDMVRRKVEGLSFDWNKFDIKTSKIDGEDYWKYIENRLGADFFAPSAKS